jgi:hypothetical protein
MLNLVEEIAASEYAYGLFATTSMTTLLIAQLPEFDMGGEVLRVSLDAKDGMLTFDFQETDSKLPKYEHWIRRCSPEAGFRTLICFLKLKKWFLTP